MSGAGQRVAAFAWQLQQQFAAKPIASDGAGFFSSPVSLYMALGLAMAGADSSTQQELSHLLHQDKARLLGLLPPPAAEPAAIEELTKAISSLSASLVQQSSSGSGAELIVANAVWTNKVAVRPEYAAAMLQLFQAEVKAASSTDVINDWAARVTKGLITQAVPPGMKFDLVLTNAVYFKGLWEYAFKKESTKQQPFRLEGGGAEVQVHMMSKSFKAVEQGSSSPCKVLWAKTGSYEAVRLPYKDSSISAIAVLPSEGLAKQGLPAAAAQLDVAELLDAAKYSRVGPLGLDIFLPKFKVKSDSVSLKQVLQRLGVTAAFDKDQANFSHLSDTPLFISDVLQSVCIVVDEEGTEAAAVTSVVMMRCAAAMAPTPTIRFDRPFLFLLVDDATSTPLFVGTVTDPSKSAA